MRVPKSLETLAEQGIIEEVLRPLMSGKEAQIYLVMAQGDVCAAKVYKDAQRRSFQNRADYTEGRKVRNTRDQRAISKGSKYGKSKDEDAWRSTEVDMIYKLRDAGVRVPTPYTFIDGVLVMELVQDPDGNPAPRLGDVQLTAEEATEIYDLLIQEVIRMLCAGVVHGDLSDFNVLLAWNGPIIIDFPQSVDPGSNLNARTLLMRDVENLHRFLARFVPGFRRRPYAEEMWSLYESNRLQPETKLTGNFKRSSARVDTSAVLELIDDANRDEAARRRNSGEKPAAEPNVLARRREVIVEKPAPRGARSGAPHGGGARPERSRPSAGSGQVRSGNRPTAQGPRSSNGQRNGPGGPRREENFRKRSDAGAGGPRRGQDRDNSGPKRGDQVQNSSYVSPEARKGKVKSLNLTPRDGSSTASATSTTANSQPDGERRRRTRQPRGRNGEERQGRANAPRQPRQGASSSESRSARGPRRPRGEQNAQRPAQAASSRESSSSTEEPRRNEEARPRRQRRRRA